MKFLPCTLLTVVCLTGCSGFVADYKLMESFVRSPDVVYSDPDQFTCEERHGTTRAGKVELCGVCQNRSRIVQVVTINKVVNQVEPGQRVIRCSDNARVMAMEGKR